MANRFFNAILKGVDESIASLNGVKFAAPRLLSRANKFVLEEFVQRITTYPPEVAGNHPPPPYWKRGVGRIVVNANITHATLWTVNPPSQKFGGDNGQLGSWKIETSEGAGGAVGVASTEVTYAPWVVGTETQAWFHRGRWKSVGEVLRDMKLGGVETILNTPTTRGAIGHYSDAVRQMVLIAKRRPI